MMMSAKLATVSLIEIKTFLSKGYDFSTSVNDVINKLLLCDSSCIVNLVIWPKFGNCSISMKEVMITSIYKDLIGKNDFF